MDWVWIIILSVYLLYIIVMIPVQYRYITETKERLNNTGKSHNELYDDMSFEEIQLQHNQQASLFNWPAIFLASIYYKLKHRHND